MGPEARPETVASRLVWGAGYFANEDYFMPVLHVQKMQRLRRGRNLVSADGTVHNVRLKRHLKDEKKIGEWSWSKDPFTGTPEWYGLRVLMAVMNNWDLKDTNNSVYLTHGEPPEERYVVSDLGGSFGPTGLNWMQKGKPAAYCSSKWIKTVTPELRRLQRTFSARGELTISIFPKWRSASACCGSANTSRARMPGGWGINWRDCPRIRFATPFAREATPPRKSNRLSSVLERRIGELEKL